VSDPGTVAEALAEQAQVEANRARARTRLSDLRDRLTAVALGGGYLLVIVLAALAGSHAGLSLPTLAAGIALYAWAFRIEFEVGPGSAIPTELVLVPLLFTLPLSLVPLAVGAGVVVGSSVGRLRAEVHVQRILVHLISAVHCLGPAAVLALAGGGSPARVGVWVLALALVAQLATDAFVVFVRHRIGLGDSLRELVAVVRWSFLIDALLAPIGVVAVIAAHGRGIALLAGVPLLVLIAVLARDRRAQLDRALALGRAYSAAEAGARRDPLTGLGNRLAWDEAVAAADADRRGPAGVVLVDLDGLKRANDSRGHAFGDVVIGTIGELLRRHGVDATVIARLGGDEFGLFFEDGAASQTERVAHSLRRAVAEHEPLDGFALSASIGWATCPPASSFVQALQLADERVYAEKRRTPGSRAA
jgi:diguanylate cyclase (GGDEF)-like protein